MNNDSQTSLSATTRQPTWQSWRLFWHSAFFVSLLIATGLAFTVNQHSWPQLSMIAGGVLLLGTWYVVFLLIPISTFRQHPWKTLGYMSLGWALWAGLIALEPTYLFVLFGFYPLVFVFLPFPWSLGGGITLLLLSLWRQLTLPDIGTVPAAFTLYSGIIGIVLMLFLQTTYAHNKKQADLIEQLQAARRELAQAERLAGMMQERQRLAADIHDTVAQGFAGIVMSIEGLNTSLSASDDRLSRVLERIEKTARASLAETRALLWALQPEVFERASLPEFLSALTARWSTEQGLAAQTLITGTVTALRPEIEVTLLRAAQEALANVWKHACARSVVLTLSYMDETVTLDVQDDGQGFDARHLLTTAHARDNGGFGLCALRERAEQQGGTLTIESEQGEGTTLALTLPALPTAFQPVLPEERR